MKKLILFSLLLAASSALGQLVRKDVPFPSISSENSTPYLVANVPPNSPILAVCFSPANNGAGLPCTNYATTFTSTGAACPNGAQDTPQPQPSACQPTGDAQGNIGFWAPAGTYDYTVTVGNDTFGPYTVTLSAPISPLGPGVNVVTTNLTSTTPGDCANWLAGSVLGDAGVCLTGLPVANQFINQPTVSGSKTSFCANVDAGVVKLCQADSTLNWSQSPTSPAVITAGVPNTVTLSKCPKGIPSVLTNIDIYLWLGGTGTPEGVKLTGSTCTSDAASGTVTFTPVNAHTTGYTIGTATGGITEAVLYARSLYAQSASILKGGIVEVDPSSSPVINATAYIQSSNVIVDFGNAQLQCYTVSAPCLFTGSAAGSTLYLNVTVKNINLRVMADSVIGIEDSSFPTYISNVSNALAPGTGGTFYPAVVVIDNDQKASLDGMNLQGTIGTSCTSLTHCTAGILVRGSPNFGLLHAKNLNMNQVNCVDNQGGNTLIVDDLVCQNVPMFLVRSRGNFADTMNLELGTVYFEGFGTTVPNPGIVGAGAGIILLNGVSKVGPSIIAGQLPRFANTGATNTVYWVCPTSSLSQAGPCLIAGYATLTTTGTLSVQWADIAPGGTYDIVRWQTDNVHGAPATSTCAGGSVGACGSVVTALAESSACNATTLVCTYTDDITASTTAYTVKNVAYAPELDFWPGAYVLGPLASTNSMNLQASLVLDNYVGGNSTTAGIVNAFGPVNSPVFASRCAVPEGWSQLAITCGLFKYNQSGAMWIRPQSLGVGSLQGALSFALPPGSSNLQSTDLITFKSADPGLTFSTPFLRPTWQAGDTASGYETAGSGGYYERDSHAIRFYINKVPDNAPQFQILSTGATTPLVITSTLATGSAPFVVASTTKVTNLNVDQTDGVSLFKFTATLSPSAVSANTCAEQLFTVTGIAIGDYVFVNKPTAQAGLGVSGVRANTTNQVGINFCNNTASPITPTASEVYGVGVLR